MRKTTIMLFVLLVVCALLAWVAYQPPPGRPSVSVSFLGYTNDTSGTRLAMMAVTNLGTSMVLVYRGCIGIPAPAEFRGWTPIKGSELTIDVFEELDEKTPLVSWRRLIFSDGVFPGFLPRVFVQEAF